MAASALATQSIAYYYYQIAHITEVRKSALLCRGVDAPCIVVHTLINYGNGTMVWHNQSDVPASWSFYELTVHIVNVTVQSYSIGHLVTSVDGVHSSGSSYWRLWILCNPKSAWYYSPLGADALNLTDGSSFAWALQSDPSQPPIGRESTVDSC